MQSYNFAPVPVRYNDINFRSLLEAKWAAFFDLVGWKYIYEPCNINGKIPDFILKCNSPHYSTENCIVEVKPNIYINEEFEKHLLTTYRSVKAHLLILDDFPFLNSKENSNLIRLGWGSQFNGFSHLCIYEFMMKCTDDFSSEMMIFDGIMYGKVERKQFLHFSFDIKIVKGLRQLWYEAGNIVQFPSYNKTKRNM